MNQRRTILAVFLTLIATGCMAELEADNEAKHRRDWRTNHRLMSDATFEDTSITAAQLQKFLAEKPTLRGTQASWLAEFRVSNRLFSERLAAIARDNRINPLVMLAWLQMKKGLVGQTTRPSATLMNTALGCGCAPDGTCGEGIDGQFKCLAKALREDFDKAKQAGAVPFADGSRRHAKLDEPTNGIAPMNRSTLAFVARLNGDLDSLDLLYSVFKQYVGQMTSVTGTNFDRFKQLPTAEGFIGGACTNDSDCFFQQGVCRTSGSRRVCTRPCAANSMCPDRLGAPTTYCVASSTASITGSGGFCVSQCSGDSCESGFECRPDVPRLGQTTHTRNVCVPPASGSPRQDPPSPGCSGPGCTSLNANDRWMIKVTQVIAPERDSDNNHFDGSLDGWLPDLMVRMAVDGKTETTSHATDDLDPIINGFLFQDGLSATSIRKPIAVTVLDREQQSVPHAGQPSELGRCTLQITDSQLTRDGGERSLNCGQGLSASGIVTPIVVKYEVRRLSSPADAGDG